MATSTPTMPEAPASSAPITSAPVTSPSTESSQPAAQPSLQDIVSQAAQSAEQELSKPPEAAPVTEAPKPVAEPATPAEAEAVKPVEAPAEAAAPNPLDKLGPLPAEKITAALTDAPPEVKTFLAEKGLTVETLSENARLAAQTSQFLERVPDIAALDVALQGNANFVKLETGLPAVQTSQDFDKFMMETLVPMSFILDDNGQPIPDPAIPGAFKNDGSIAKLIDYSAAVRDSKIGELADLLIKSASTDEGKAYATDLKGAVDFLNAFIKNGYKQPGTETKVADLPPEIKERLDRADRIERESKDRESTTQKATYENTENKILGLTDKALNPTIEQFWKQVGTALPDKLKTTITRLAWQELTDLMDKNDAYKRERDLLSPKAQDYEQRRVALNKKWMTERMVKTLENIVGDMGKPVTDAQTARLTKLDSQSTASAMEPKTSGTTRQGFPAASSPDQVHAKAMELARAENPNAREGGAEYWKAVLKLEP